MDNAAEFLAEAKDALRRAHGRYRDSLLECGRYLHHYVDMILRAEMTERERRAFGVSREQAIRNAATELGCKPNKVAMMIVTAMVADLLVGGQIGDLWHVTVYCFRPFVRRRQGRFALPKEKETWDLRDGFQQSAPELLRRAIAETWNAEKARREVGKLFRSGGGDSRRPRRSVMRRQKVRKAIEELQRSARLASPGDIAEMCLTLIESSEDSKAAAILLRDRLNEVIAKRRPIFLEEAPPPRRKLVAV